MDKRNKLFVKNSIYSLLQQMVAVVCGLVLPQLILRQYGSVTNGAISSITQFLSFIILLQGGVGTVARLAYYKPLAEKSDQGISVAYKTVSQFFQKFSVIFAVYLVVLAFVYPVFSHTGYSYLYIFSLVLIVGFSSVSEYFFGQASQLLLTADQRGYVYSVIQIFCLIVSTALCSAMIVNGASIHAVKFVYAIVFTVRPILLYKYVEKHYNILKDAKPDAALLSQRNAALVRHIAFYIHTSTDVMVLTLFSNLIWVSIYTVHKYVINCLSNLVSSILGNTEAVFGDMYAKKEFDKLKQELPVYDILTKIIAIGCFTACMILISPFVTIYTSGVNDADYYQPVFAVVITAAEMVYLSGITYQNAYIAAGHIKKTEWIAVTEACINMVLSIALVFKYHIMGVAIGTIVAMIFKTIANIWYMEKNVIQIPVSFIVKEHIVDFGISALLTFIFNVYLTPMVPVNNYIQFFIYAAIVAAIVIIVLTGANYIAFPQYTKKVVNNFKHKVLHK